MDNSFKARSRASLQPNISYSKVFPPFCQAFNSIGNKFAQNRGDKYAREAASLREAPPSRSLPKSGWRSGYTLLLTWFRLYVGRISDKLGYGHGG